MQQKIKDVQPGSIGEELGLEAGDILLSIDDQPVEDVLDYYYLMDSEYITLQILTKDGETAQCEVEKDEDEDLGLIFEDQFMGTYQHCHNHCIFCFIDQLPKGMRDTLYFKDDDARLSFLNGNYITMTNMQEADFEKIIRYQMSPINVSVHTTDPQLRVAMLRNPRASEIMERLRRLAQAGITLNGQIVLCKGVNDGKALDRTIRELSSLRPQMQSVSIVPVGLSRHREGLYPLEAFDAEDCARIIDQVEPYQQQFFAEDGMHFIHLSDEFYIQAGRELPEEERYDGYLQIENGVGMMRLFVDEAMEAIEALDPQAAYEAELSLVTAPSASGYIRQLCQRLEERYPKLHIRVHVIVNHFFGEHITVTGLLTGQDICAQLKGQELGERLLLPENLLRSGEEVLLDDMTLTELENTLQIPISIVKSSGSDLIHSMIERGRGQ
ncbi:MAG: DUF512 domain-containing protein [Lachnospiraceae bacterium]|nr:DUF512 domain-containing protein [Lachnospiraceae bacterium]